MALRRIFMQLGIVASSLAFALTLWLTLTQWKLTLFEGCVRAVLAGIGVMILSVIILGLIERLAGPNTE